MARGSLHLGRGVYEGGGAEGSQGSEGSGEQWGGEGWRLRSECLPSPHRRRPGAPPRPPPTSCRQRSRPLWLGGAAPEPLHPWGPQGAPAALWLPEGGWCDRGSASFDRESIFKIGHSKSRKKVQNPDPRSYVARGSLHLARWVYEGSRAAPAAARPTALGEDVRVTPGRLSRRSESCHHSIHTAPLLRSSLRSAGGSAASGACLTPSTRRPRPEGGEGGYKRGRGRRPRPRRLGFVGDWALPTTIS